jgi:predicted  nucleic acid-binding Zn-ribbon protein
MSDIPDEQRLIPLSDFTLLEEKLASLEEERTKIIDERNQLRDALAQVNSGITKASDIVTEGIARLKDKQAITNLVFELVKSHPNHITVKYRGEDVVEIHGER